MTDQQFYTVWGAALTAPNRDAFVSDWAMSSIWGDKEDAEIPVERIDALAGLWTAAHMSVREIRAHTGLSQAAFAVRFCIPKRTIENWEAGSRQCPDYLRLLLAEETGAYSRP